MQTAWTVFYDSEEELISDMLKAKADVNNTLYCELCKGYVYVSSFQKYYQKNGKLTDKQMVQLKRLAKFIYANVHNKNIPLSARVEAYR